VRWRVDRQASSGALPAAEHLVVATALVLARRLVERTPSREAVVDRLGEWLSSRNAWPIATRPHPGDQGLPAADKLC
jgi:hypothetical protein